MRPILFNSHFKGLIFLKFGALCCLIELLYLNSNLYKFKRHKSQCCGQITGSSLDRLRNFVMAPSSVGVNSSSLQDYQGVDERDNFEPLPPLPWPSWHVRLIRLSFLV